ncbi:hypothetical protein V2J09_002579 [Rumex salicifolius]
MSNSSPESEFLVREMGNTRMQGFRKPSPVDIADMLPSDPFGMARESDSEEITASVEGFSAEFQSQLMDSRKAEFEGNRGGDGLLPGLNLLCRGRVRLIPEMNNMESDGKSNGFSIDKFLLDDVDESQGCRESFFGAEGKVNSVNHVSHAPAQRDVADSLPSDPFGMDVSTAFWGITGSFEGLDDIDWSYESGDHVNKREGDGLVFGLNLVCRGRFRFMPDVGNDESDSKKNTFSIDRVIVANEMEEFMDFGPDADSDTGSTIEDVQGCSEISDESHGGEPHYAMFLALRYLGVKDLLSVEMVCRSLNYAVKSDPSMWMNCNVDHPLNNILTDDALIKLTSRACGHLKTLTLVGCLRITNAGIKHIVDNNPCLTKLSVPGCFRLNIAEMLTTFKSAGVSALKQLRIGGLAGVTSEQYEDLKILLRVDDQLQSRPHKPVYYHDSNSCISVDDDRPIDIEKCPRCNEVRLVYDCPSESCQKTEASNSCKACFLCVNRCINCGCCLTNRDYVETFVLDAICLDCWDKIFNSQEGEERQEDFLALVCHRKKEKKRKKK